MPTAGAAAPREVTGAPSTPRTSFLKARYLEAPLRWALIWWEKPT